MPARTPTAGIVRLPIVGVMGSAVDAHADRARQVGRWIAAHGYHLLTGGGDGVMGAVTEAFVNVRERAGAALAVVPCLPGDAAATPLPAIPTAGWRFRSSRTSTPAVRRAMHRRRGTISTCCRQRSSSSCRADQVRRARRAWRCATASGGRLSARARGAPGAARGDSGRSRFRAGCGVRPAARRSAGQPASRRRTAASCTAVTNTGMAWSISSSAG